MSLDQAGPGRFYYFVPDEYAAHCKALLEKPEFTQTVHLTFNDGVINELKVEEISDIFADFGDFYICKDTATSCFIEFFYVDKDIVHDGKLETFNKIVV